MVEIHRTRADVEQIVADGRPLAELLVRNHLLHRAGNVLLQVIALERSDASLRRQLVIVLLALGERTLALEHLHALAALLEHQQAPGPEIREAYGRIVKLDPKDWHANKR